MSREPAVPPTIDADAFAARFPGIRVEMDWQRFRAERWPVRFDRLETPDEVRALRSAFLSRFGRVKPRFIKTVFSRSILIGEAAQRIGDYSARDQAWLLGLAERYRAAAAPVTLDLPAYALPDGTRLVLDGNHRAIALLLAEVPFTLNVFSIEGPARHGFFVPDRPWLLGRFAS